MSLHGREIGLGALITFVCCVNCGPPSTRQTIHDYFQREHHLQFFPQEILRVGTVVKIHDRQVDIQCFPKECIPNVEGLRNGGDIRRDSLPPHQSLAFIADDAVLKLFGFGAGLKRAKQFEATFQDCTIEQASVQTATNWYPDEFDVGIKYLLTARQKPRAELVFRALWCESAEFQFLDKNGAAIDISTPRSLLGRSLPPQQGFLEKKNEQEQPSTDSKEKNDEAPQLTSAQMTRTGYGRYKVSGWIAFRSGIFRREKTSTVFKPSAAQSDPQTHIPSAPSTAGPKEDLIVLYEKTSTSKNLRYISYRGKPVPKNNRNN